MPRTQDVARSEQLSADGVVEHHLARQDALGDQQAQVQRVRVGEPPAVPLSDRECGDPHAQFMLRELAALGRQQLPELRVEVEQRPSCSGRARRACARERHVAVIIWAIGVGQLTASASATRKGGHDRAVSAVPGLAEDGASVLDVDPGLMHVIGRRTAAGFVRRRVLPVLSVAPGSWAPPAAARCGPDTFALAVLDGLLMTESRALKGPGDMIAPWGSDWVACTPVRLAVIGRAYLNALARWPAMQQRVRSRLTPSSSGHVADAGTLDERLVALLWRIALRWSSVREAGIALPQALDARALSLLLEVSEEEVAAALVAARDRGVGATRDGTIWLRAGPDREAADPSDRDVLRVRAAVALALGRAACADSAQLCEDLDLMIARRDALRAQSASSGGVRHRAADPDQLT